MSAATISHGAWNKLLKTDLLMKRCWHVYRIKSLIMTNLVFYMLTITSVILSHDHKTNTCWLSNRLSSWDYIIRLHAVLWTVVLWILCLHRKITLSLQLEATLAATRTHSHIVGLLLLLRETVETFCRSSFYNSMFCPTNFKKKQTTKPHLQT